MLWLLMLHIASLLVWCAALIYLPVLLVSHRTREAHSQPASYRPSIEHFVFTHFATPFALLAIISGSLIFMTDGTTEPWLIVKLSAVAGLVICHALLGLLILRTENIDRVSASGSDGAGLPSTLRIGSYLLLAAVCSLIVTVLWLVLAKPTLVWFQ